MAIPWHFLYAVCGRRLGVREDRGQLDLRYNAEGVGAVNERWSTRRYQPSGRAHLIIHAIPMVLACLRTPGFVAPETAVWTSVTKKTLGVYVGDVALGEATHLWIGRSAQTRTQLSGVQSVLFCGYCGWKTCLIVFQTRCVGLRVQAGCWMRYTVLGPLRCGAQ
ncbi:hypothetical protein EXIGLDRAFT_498408 [Exidia glandulosa HHB12029]|uniref:Uncharacterized protein n=1 Tax=Exidia glandulosa HHB12029 TaxID=1314781 RepID=A0A166N844_EXIGL|nr:hypothetical protein EXIGLDRAFT_498408 [Exidia glandulosa HHB12029]